MRRFRRLAAVVTHLLMIHLAIVSGASRCPMADGADGSGAIAAHAMHDHALASAAVGAYTHDASHHAPTHGRQHATECEHSCPPADCSAAGHCASAVARGSLLPVGTDQIAAGPIRVAAEVPRSVTAAPEPPPPRAPALV